MEISERTWLGASSAGNPIANPLPGMPPPLQADDLYYRHKHSPYIGRPMRGRIVRTLVRGVAVYHDGRIVSAPMGQLLRPIRT